MKLPRTVVAGLASGLLACAHGSPAPEPVRDFSCDVVTASDPAPPAPAPTPFAEGALVVDVPALEPEADSTATRGSVRGDFDGRFYAIHFRRGDELIDRATVRRIASGLRIIEGELEEIALADGRPALRGRSTSADTGDHRVTIVFGTGPFLIVVTVARMESYPEDEALRAASSVRETAPTPGVGGCMLEVGPMCHECVPSASRVCTFEESRCTGGRRWFPEGCPDAYDHPVLHQATRRTTACIVSDGAEVVHQYAWQREGEEWPPPPTRVSDCERLHGRLAPAEPRARVTP